MENMKQKNMPTVNSGYGRVPIENKEATAKAKDRYSTAEMRVLPFETEGSFLSVSDIKVANLSVSDYEDGFDGTPEELIFE